jgi:addiction module HigA family antidote
MTGTVNTSYKRGHNHEQLHGSTDHSIGEFLTEEFLRPLNISAYRLAKDIRVPVSRIQEILNDERVITIDTGLRLCHDFGKSEMFTGKGDL